MDTIFYYRLIEAARETLEDAGLSGFVLSRAENLDSWFDLEWLADFLEGQEHQRLALRWKGKPLPDLRTLHVDAVGYSSTIRREQRTGSVFVCRDVAVAPLLGTNQDGRVNAYVAVGERRSGALQRFLEAYDAYARTRARSWPFLWVIGNDPLPRPRGLDWSNLRVPPTFRDELRRQVEGFFSMQDVYGRLGIPHRRGLLFTGPPGNGKTTALRVIASCRTEPFILFSLTSETEKYELDEAFSRARNLAPSILCFEDVDSLFQNQFPLSHFLNRLDGLHPLQGVLVIATTNHPEKLDAAITDRPSRFDRIFLFGNPAEEERMSFLKDLFNDEYAQDLAEQTHGFSMAQVKEVWISSCLEAIERGRTAPTAEFARRAIELLRGQRESIVGDWEISRPIGFQWSRARREPGPTS